MKTNLHGQGILKLVEQSLRKDVKISRIYHCYHVTRVHFCLQFWFVLEIFSMVKFTGWRISTQRPLVGSKMRLRAVSFSLLIVLNVSHPLQHNGFGLLSSISSIMNQRNALTRKWNVLLQSKTTFEPFLLLIQWRNSCNPVSDRWCWLTFWKRYKAFPDYH